MKQQKIKTREDFLREAEDLINRPRAMQYGPAKKHHERIAQLWTLLLDKKLKVPFFKIPSGEINSSDMISYISRRNKRGGRSV